jgi:hypothetical protein
MTPDEARELYARAVTETRCHRCGADLVGVRPRLRAFMPDGSKLPVCTSCAAEAVPEYAGALRLAEQACRDADFRSVVSDVDDPEGGAA